MGPLLTLEHVCEDRNRGNVKVIDCHGQQVTMGLEHNGHETLPQLQLNVNNLS